MEPDAIDLPAPPVPGVDGPVVVRFLQVRDGVFGEVCFVRGPTGHLAETWVPDPAGRIARSGHHVDGVGFIPDAISLHTLLTLLDGVPTANGSGASGVK